MSADELRQDWEVFGRPEGYESAKEPELKALSDPRHRKRGELMQGARIKRSRQQLEREWLAERQRRCHWLPGLD